MLLWRVFNILSMHTSENKNYNWISLIFIEKLLVKMAEYAQCS